MRAQPAMNHCAFQLHRNQAGRLVFTGADGRAHEGVVPVRAFPISARPAACLWSAPTGMSWPGWTSGAVAAAQRQLVEAELASREFMPEIRRIVSVSTFATPSSWQVETDRGNATFVLRGEEDIRRLAGHTLLITDMHGIFFLIRDALALDRHSRKLLDRFL